MQMIVNVYHLAAGWRWNLHKLINLFQVAHFYALACALYGHSYAIHNIKVY